MALSKLAITFTETNRVGHVVGFTIKGPKSYSLGPLNMKFRNLKRIKPYQINLIEDEFQSTDPITFESLSSLVDPELAATIYAYYFKIDHNPTGQFLVNVNGATVTITHRTTGFIFTDLNMPGATVVLENDETANVDYLTVTESTFGPSDTDVQNKYKVNIKTSRDFETIALNSTSGTIVLPQPTDDYTVELLRDVEYSFFIAIPGDTFKVWPGTGFKIPKLVLGNFTITSKLNIGGTTITATPNFVSAVTYEYAISQNDGSVYGDWAKNGTFYNLPEGDYTVKVRDLYDGKPLGTELVLNVLTSTLEDVSAIASISKANSLYFIKEHDYNNYDKPINIDNSFSWESVKGQTYCHSALFNTLDKVKFQIRSTYENIVATLRRSDGVEYTPEVVQLTDNVNKYISLDCIAMRHEEDKTALFFTSGNQYSKIGNIPTPYELNGSLPDFAQIGNIVEVSDLGIFEIQGITYISAIQANAIIIDYIFQSDSATQHVAKSIFSILNYDVYEVGVDFSIHGNETYDMVVEFTDERFDDVRMVSENILVADEHPDTVSIRSFNSGNRDIFYKYDIEHFSRFEVISSTFVMKDEVENNITDKSVTLLKSTLNEGRTFNFGELTYEQAIKLSIILSSEFLFIDDIGYCKSSEFEIEPIENTNLVAFTAELLRTGQNYSTLSEDINTVSLGAEETLLPALLTQSTNFIKF